MPTTPFSYKKLNSFLSNERLSIINEHVDALLNDPHADRLHSNVVQVNKTDVENDETLKELKDDIERALIAASGFSDLTFNKLWIVQSESTDTDKTKLPYIPHFDKNRYLKGMVYLHDISSEHGPIHLANAKKCVDIDKKRRKLPSNYKELALNSVSSEDLDGEFDEITGQRGDLVLFDTNTPHYAGVVADGMCRKVLRFDFENSSFNSRPSFLRRVAKRIFG